ncbi:type II toxin-antitoxin system RelE/ParE family toxin [Subtercola endophyticus]|uniref:type II toxin-antitoxin system RelE/ParE family toxin n=1 Tax=Subtercola endophyticus TaxID=2895559 RepID=UPI001E5AB7EA|nr:type II toxin-antitoxin system RelE/ParE family toxin [Subtercola endophyticus]UFS58294.1 type II toxin-antitoxin system RelE/ParE family toxin [Subtercola endophyticus]
MIKSFAHKGLAVFYATGSAKGIVPQHARRLRLILATLDDAATPAGADLPAFDLHPLKGELAGMFSVRVNGNWRVIFAFDDEDVILVDYLDYH